MAIWTLQKICSRGNWETGTHAPFYTGLFCCIQHLDLLLDLPRNNTEDAYDLRSWPWSFMAWIRSKKGYWNTSLLIKAKGSWHEKPDSLLYRPSRYQCTKTSLEKALHLPSTANMYGWASVVCMDESEICNGHRKTYIMAMPGRIVWNPSAG